MVNGRYAINFFKIRWVADLKSSINERSWISNLFALRCHFLSFHMMTKTKLQWYLGFDDFSPQCMIFKARKSNFLMYKLFNSIACSKHKLSLLLLKWNKHKVVKTSKLLINNNILLQRICSLFILFLDDRSWRIIEIFGLWNYFRVAAISGAAVMTRVLSGYSALCIPETTVLIRGLGHPLVKTGHFVHTPTETPIKIHTLKISVFLGIFYSLQFVTLINNCFPFF